MTAAQSLPANITTMSRYGIRNETGTLIMEIQSHEREDVISITPILTAGITLPRHLIADVILVLQLLMREGGGGGGQSSAADQPVEITPFGAGYNSHEGQFVPLAGLRSSTAQDDHTATKTEADTGDRRAFVGSGGGAGGPNADGRV